MIQLKKNYKVDLTNYTTLFFNIGLVISLLIVIMAFEWKRIDDGSVVDLTAMTENFEDLLDIPQTQQPPPPPPKKIQPHIIVVPDEEEIKEEIEIDLDIEMTEDTEIEEVIIFDVPEDERVDEIFTIVEETAVPEGGLKAFYAYVQKQLKYPTQARRMGIEGKVFIQFVIDKQGNISEIEVVKGIGAGCDEESIRVLKGYDINGKRLKGYPKWKPGKQRGQPVFQRMILPLTFKLG